VPRQTKKRSRTRRATLCCILARAVTEDWLEGIENIIDSGRSGSRWWLPA